MPPTALIVDDDAGFRRAAGRLLAARGFAVVAEAADAAHALAAVRTHHPDCVLLDVHLPDGDGLALARTLAALAGPRPRILVTSTDLPVFATPDLDLAEPGVVGFAAKDRLATVDLWVLFGFRPG